MRRGSLIGRFVVLAVAATLVFGAATFGLAGCAARGAKTVKIGVPIPLSGAFGVYGEAMKQGTELAVKEINESGGLLGKQVEVFYEDTQSEVQPAIDKVKSLIDKDNVDVLIGIISSAERDAVIPTSAPS